MAIDDVHDEIYALLNDQTNIHWYEYRIPDNEDVPEGVYGLAIPGSPTETNVGRGITGITNDPYIGYELIVVTAPTVDALKIQAKNVEELLRGFEPSNTTELHASTPRGYEPVTSKFKPSLVSRHMLFTYMTNLNRV